MYKTHASIRQKESLERTIRNINLLREKEPFKELDIASKKTIVYISHSAVLCLVILSIRTHRNWNHISPPKRTWENQEFSFWHLLTFLSLKTKFTVPTCLLKLLGLQLTPINSSNFLYKGFRIKIESFEKLEHLRNWKWPKEKEPFKVFHIKFTFHTLQFCVPPEEIRNG